MKKLWHILIFLGFFIFLPKTACAEDELQLPPFPIKVCEFEHLNATKSYRIEFQTTNTSEEKTKYVKATRFFNYYPKGKELKSTVFNRKGLIVTNTIFLRIHQGNIVLNPDDVLVFHHQGYFKLKLTFVGSEEDGNDRVWNFHCDILDKNGKVIENPVAFAEVRAKKEIESLDHLPKKYKDAFLAELATKHDYMDIYAVLEKAIKRNAATPEKLELFDLVEEKRARLTEDEIAEFEKAVELCQNSEQERTIREDILRAADATVPNLNCTIAVPRTGESLPREVTFTPAVTASMKLSWTFNGESYRGTAQENTVYTAHCAFTLADGKRLIPWKSKVTINDSAEVQELLEENGKYTIAYTFPATEPLVQTYEITWDGNGGTGTMTPTPVTNGKLRLPKCSFTPPTGQQFDAWLVNGTQHSSGEEIEITNNVTIVAQWKAIPPSSESRSPRASDRHVPEESTVRLHARDGSGAYVDGSARALGNARELVVVKKDRTKWELSLRDASGREVYSNALMLVTVPVESIGRENLRLLVDGVYTSFSVSEDGKSITFPAYFTKDGQRPAEDLLFEAHGIEVRGKHTTLPGEDYRFIVEEKSARKFEVKLLNAQGKEMHTTGPVWISFPAPEGDFSCLTVKCDGRETTFEIVNGRVRVATII